MKIWDSVYICTKTLFRFQIRIGDKNHTSSNDDSYAFNVDILQSFPHPDYEKHKAYFDIAILKTEEIPFSILVNPICLPNVATDSFDEYDDRYVELIGWGKKVATGRTSTSLKKVSLTVFPFR